MTCTVRIEDNSLVFSSPYDPALVAELKSSVPPTDRKWDTVRKVWIVAPQHAARIAELSKKYFGDTPDIQTTLFNTGTSVIEKTFVVKYIGACKDRGGERTAFGWVDGEWSVIFPEPVLREWFDMSSQPDEAQTLYQVLAVKKSASTAEIKTAFRRLAKQWHPDVCKEPNAAEQFKRIGEAYAILSDPNKRARYDAGLALEATLNQRQSRTAIFAEWRPPLRCGVIAVRGEYRIGRFVVQKILSWQDIIENGKTLVVSWPAGSDHFVENWVLI
jgi:hypothetical protein